MGEDVALVQLIGQVGEEAGRRVKFYGEGRKLGE